MSISKIKENARTALTGKWGKGACIILAYFAILVAIGFVVGMFEDVALIGTLVSIAELIISIPLGFGLTFSLIKLKRNEEVNAFDFLNLGFSNFRKAWGITLSVLLKLILPLLAILVIGVVLGICAGYSVIGGASIATLGMIGLVSIVAYMVILIWYIARSLLYSLTSYIAYDNTNMSSSDVVNESARLMKGNRCKIFLLELSFIGWAILAGFTFGIGLLWLVPYMQLSAICFYEYLLGKNEVISKEEENVEAIKEI